MADNAPAAESYFTRWKRASLAPKMLMLAGLSAILSGAACLGYWRFKIVPELAVAQTRFTAHMALMRLFDLQIAYRTTHPTYANSLEEVIAGTPDAAKLLETLKATTDINTLVVRGDDKRFRLEANYLDPERTAVKYRGPTGGR